MSIKTWLQKNAQSLDGKTLAVTGSTGGLGKEICLFAAELGASLILLNRSEERSMAQIKDLKAKFPLIKTEYIYLDLEDISSVKSVCEKLKTCPPDIFIHNAGTYSIPRHKCTTGFDNVYQINFASPYFMIRELMGLIPKTVVVGSIAHTYSKIDENDIDFSCREKSSLVYGNSKRFLMFSLYELFKDEKNSALSVSHPGITFTNITAHYPKLLFAIIKNPMKIIFMKPKKAALSIVRGIFDDCGYNEWIGPRLFNVWGLPSKKTLSTCSKEEISKIAQIADTVYEKCKLC